MIRNNLDLIFIIIYTWVFLLLKVLDFIVFFPKMPRAVRASWSVSFNSTGSWRSSPANIHTVTAPALKLQPYHKAVSVPEACPNHHYS